MNRRSRETLACTLSDYGVKKCAPRCCHQSRFQSFSSWSCLVWRRALHGVPFSPTCRCLLGLCSPHTRRFTSVFDSSAQELTHVPCNMTPGDGMRKSCAQLRRNIDGQRSRYVFSLPQFPVPVVGFGLRIGNVWYNAWCERQHRRDPSAEARLRRQPVQRKVSSRWLQRTGAYHPFARV